jgi:hypothetical protein
MSEKITCNYKFPCHPADMFSKSPKALTQSTRNLRVYMINVIADLSQTFSQDEIDSKVFVDVDDSKQIIGLDVSQLVLGSDGSMCVGKPTRLGKMTVKNWTKMRM